MPVVVTSSSPATGRVPSSVITAKPAPDSHRARHPGQQRARPAAPPVGRPTSSPRPSSARPTPAIWWRFAAADPGQQHDHRRRADGDQGGQADRGQRHRGEVTGLEQRGQQAGLADPQPGRPAARDAAAGEPAGSRRAAAPPRPIRRAATASGASPAESASSRPSRPPVPQSTPATTRRDRPRRAWSSEWVDMSSAAPATRGIGVAKRELQGIARADAAANAGRALRGGAPRTVRSAGCAPNRPR